ncbi:MAG: methyltransferase domain-containing protein [Phycisphaerales bacterium]|nr:MAG: methyltransferase domain-containing protein [Phycisphaerales bacterium]
MEPDLTSILRCPISQQPLRRLSPEQQTRISRLTGEGRLRHRDGTGVTERYEAGFVSEDGRYFYPVVDDIVFLLPDGAIVLDEASSRSVHHERIGHFKKEVRDFYEKIGWQRQADGTFTDAASWEDLRPVSAQYRHRCHLRVTRHLPASGRYLLDAASGPIQYDEYLEYSAQYDRRICVDVSLRALREAHRRLGRRGVYLLADITHLPLRDDCVDAAVSLHTVYHVPADEQERALNELHRVLKPGGTTVVVYSWGSGAPLMRVAFFPFRLARILHNLLRRRSSRSPAGAPTIYFHCHDRAWFASRSWPFGLEMRTWRSCSVPFLRLYVHRWLLGRPLLALVYWLEERLPHWAGRLGQYPMLIFRKHEALGETLTPVGAIGTPEHAQTTER